MKVFTSAILIYLWGLINGLQLNAMTCLFKIRLPTNVQTTFIQIMKLAAFDFLQTEALYMKIFRFSPTPSFNSSFDEAAFSGANFILGLGSSFLMMLGYALFLITRWVIVRQFHDERHCARKIVPWFQKHNVEATCIRFILEGNIDIFINALISILNVENSRSLGGKFWDVFSNLLGCVMLLVLAYAPLHSLYRAL